MTLTRGSAAAIPSSNAAELSLLPSLTSTSSQLLPSASSAPHTRLYRIGIFSASLYSGIVTVISMGGGGTKAAQFTPLSIQFHPIPKLLQRLRVRQGVGVLHWPPMNPLAHRQFRDLAGNRARDIGHLENLRRHVARR